MSLSSMPIGVAGASSGRRRAWAVLFGAAGEGRDVDRFARGYRGKQQVRSVLEIWVVPDEA